MSVRKAGRGFLAFYLKRRLGQFGGGLVNSMDLILSGFFLPFTYFK